MAVRAELVAIIGGAVLAACATGSEPQAPEAPSTYAFAPTGEGSDAAMQTGGELPPQTLEPGECGAFFWSAGEPHRFLVFDNVTQGRVRVHADGQMREMTSPMDEADFVVGVGYAGIKVDNPSGLIVSIDGSISSGTADGLRITPARLQVERADGQRLIMPLVGHYTCRLGS